jgi:SpoVK/Ycf46/Vps4 family AAA+-type ATPase
MIPGGVADKLGNEYEAYWTLLQLLRVIQGLASAIRVEPFNDDANGFEFWLTENDIVQWHQCKHVSSGSWTVSAMERHGILTDFARKLRGEKTECVFVTSLPVTPFRSLTAKARQTENSTAFLSILNEDEEKGLQALLGVWGTDATTTYSWLRRCRVEIGSPDAQQRRVEEYCGLIFRGDPRKATALLRLIANETLTQTLTTDTLRERLQQQEGLEWRSDLNPTVDGLIREASDAYLRTLRTTIAGVKIETPAAVKVLDALNDDSKKHIIISGPAGSGKSAIISALIENARALGYPALAFRIDRFLSSNSVLQLGEAIAQVSENPASLLGNRFVTSKSLLIIDQVDAVSEASGRSSHARELLFQLLQSAVHYPRLKVVLACRTYDLENDFNFSHISKAETTALIKLPALDWETSVKPIIDKLGLSQRAFSDHEKRILTLPINLSLFSEVVASGENVPSDLSTGRLIHLLLQVRERECREAQLHWSPIAALGAVAEAMSRNQELIASASVLGGYPGAVTTLSSYGLITCDNFKVQFIHESFFDHIFAESFINSGTSALDLLISGEQRLFRRTQVRQIFTRLRDIGSERRYFTELSTVMESDKVRYLIKDAIGSWLTTIDAPTPNEIQLVLSWLTPRHPLENLARAVIHRPNWFPKLVDRGVIQDWLEGPNEARQFGMWVLRVGADTHPNECAKVLRSFWRKDSDRLDEITAWFSSFHARGPIGDLEAVYIEIVKASPAAAFEGTDASLRLNLSSWTDVDPELAIRMLGAWLTRWLEVRPEGDPFGDIRRGGSEGHWLNELATRAPSAFLNAVLPNFALAIVRDLEEVRTGARYYSSFTNVRKDDLPDEWLDFVCKAVKASAADAPDHTASLLDLLPREAQTTVYLELEAISANGRLASRLLNLLDHPRLLKAGYAGTEWLSFATAAKTAMPYLTPSECLKLEEIALNHRPEMRSIRRYYLEDLDGNAIKPSPEARRHAVMRLAWSGRASRAILRTIGEEQLSECARRQLAELDRKFPSEPLPEPIGTRGGWVQSPIPPTAAAKMSDAQWLQAIARYKDNSDRAFLKGKVLGGSGALSSVLREQTKLDPLRFATLLENIPLTAPNDYPEGIIMGLHDAKISPEIALKSIRIALQWPGHEMDRMICWLLQNHPSLSDEPGIVDFVCSIAVDGAASNDIIKTTSPKDPDRLPSVNEILSHSDDLEHSGLNSQRGAAYRVLANMLWHSGDIYGQMLPFMRDRIGREPLRSVRMQMFGVINSVSKYEATCGIDLLKQMAATDVHSLTSNDCFHVLAWASYNYSEAVLPLLDLMIGNQSEQLRAMGIFMLSGIALGDVQAEALLLTLASQDQLARRVTAFRSRSLSVSFETEDSLKWAALQGRGLGCRFRCSQLCNS